MNYWEKKEQARQEAIEWQMNFAERNYSWGELAYWGSYFEELGRKYGLLKEFRENAIC